jgi:hypothetical protein
MVCRKLFICLIFGIISFFTSHSFANAPQSNADENNRRDSAYIDSITRIKSTKDDTSSEKLNTFSEKNYGPLYDYYLDKADRAYSIGFFKRAKRFYEKAALINPNSLYIKYRISQIDNTKGKLNSLILYFNFDKPGLLIRSLTYLVVYFIISMIIILLFILMNRRRMENIEKKEQYLKERYQELLVDYLFSSESSPVILKQFNDLLASSFNQKILINQMIDLSINLTGDAKEKLRNLYLVLYLDKVSINKVYSPHWHIKIKGFHELSFMDITDANEEIIRCLQSKNEIVRMEAQLAMVRLNHEDPFGFLDHLEKPFTLWEQLTIYETIIFHNIPVPSFDRWLFSKNKSVIIFAIRMIDLFKQKEAYSNLFWMLVNDDPEIRYNTIYVIGNLKNKEALPHLKRLYKTENYQNCRAIIQAMGKMPDISMLNFLKLVLDKEDDVQLQIDAAIAIHNMGEEGEKALEKLLDSDYKNYQIIVKHVLDKRIN